MKVRLLVLLAALLICLGMTAALAEEGFAPGTFSTADELMSVACVVSDVHTTDTTATITFDRELPGGSYRLYYRKTADGGLDNVIAEASGRSLTFAMPSGWVQDGYLCVETYYSGCDWTLQTTQGSLRIDNGVLVQYVRFLGAPGFAPARIVAVPEDRTDYTLIEFKNGVLYSYTVSLYEDGVCSARLTLNGNDELQFVQVLDANGTTVQYLSVDAGSDMHAWQPAAAAYALRFPQR